MSKNDFIKNGSEAASPVPYQQSGGSEFYCLTDGLTKREHFAGLAMQGILSHSFGRGRKQELAVEAVACADALLKELESKEL